MPQEVPSPVPARFAFTLNGQSREARGPRDLPLLWYLRDTLGLTGTKFGCGKGICGACTVVEGSTAVRACQVTIEQASGKNYTTIEGLSPDGTHPVQRAWLAENVAQCGYCQPGMILEVVALLLRDARPGASEIASALDGHVCRCGSYPRIRKAIERVVHEQP
ncbi:MAG: (2Fe-2S)-binding protein [Thermoanaerobaculia bacterium]